MHTLHILPFHISHDGEAQVSKGFPVSRDEETDPVKFTASFRGRKLTGAARLLPTDLRICRVERDGELVSVSDSFDCTQVNVIEWNKEDVPEKPKVTFASFSRLVSLQAQVHI